MRVAAVLIAALILSGCESMHYYAQAIGGHLDIMRAARPVGVARRSRHAAGPALPPGRRAAREFARASSRCRETAASAPTPSFLGRPYVAWNVYAAPMFSTEAKQECFPFAGCVSYRGFFSEADARQHAEKLRSAVTTCTPAAPRYSTLGWFDDPLLSSFIRFPDAQLARLLFTSLPTRWSTRATTPGSTNHSRWRWRRRAPMAEGPGARRRVRRLPGRAGPQARARGARRPCASGWRPSIEATSRSKTRNASRPKSWRSCAPNTADRARRAEQRLPRLDRGVHGARAGV